MFTSVKFQANYDSVNFIKPDVLGPTSRNKAEDGKGAANVSNK